MATNLEVSSNSIFSHLSTAETIDINNKVEFEINKTHYGMLKLGAVANIISGIVVGLVLYYGHATPHILIGWYFSLLFFSLLDIFWANQFEASNVTLEDLRVWRKIFYFILAAICLTWGSIGVFFTPDNVHYELYATTFLQVVVIGFSFATATDFTIAAISICCLLIPTTVFRFYLGFHYLFTIGYDPGLNFAFGVNFFILGAFLLAASFLGARLAKRFFILTYTNVVLGQQLENINKFLEQRVKERTIELEDSLKLVKYQASHDLLTDLPNQRLLLEYAQAAIQSANQNKHVFALVCFSLNEIEKINDALGHQAGDYVIKTVAKRFEQLFVDPAKNNLQNSIYTVTLSRKDIFVILVNPIYELNEIEQKINVLFSVLDMPISVENSSVKLTASTGISIYPRDGIDISALIMNADAAMIQARKQGGNAINIYRPEINANLSMQLFIESNLHSAVKNKEFVLYYQPFVSAKTGQICGMEALIRWMHPTLGFIPPDNFIPLAEVNGIIIPLGEWVLRTACAQAKLWYDKGFTSIKVAVNLSAKQLHSGDIVKTITDILKETGLKNHCLELELTETTAFQEDSVPILKQFKEMGLSLSIDDFGTGYAGLSNLKLFTIDKLKIDKSFVQDLSTNDDSKAIVANTIDLAKKINVTVLAEGVETKEQLILLQEYGCDMIQGYYFSQPLSADVFTELLESRVLIKS